MSRNRWFCLILSLALCLLVAGTGAAHPLAQITVMGTAPAQPVPRLLFGQNVLAAGNGLWDHRLGGPEPEAALYLRRLAPTVLRFPGGSLSDWYIWEDGLGVASPGPIPPQITTLTLPQPPWWTGGRRLRFLSRQGGKYGEVVSYTGVGGQELYGLQARQQSYPAGVRLRPEGRVGQPAWHANDFGTAEFFELCQQLNAVPVMTVNHGSGLDATGRVTPRVSLSQRIKRAAAWVAFANGVPQDQRPLGLDEEGHDWQTVGFWAKQRVELGRTAPWGVVFWEIGNEVYEPHEVGATTAEQYAHNLVAFSRAMKEVDPSIQIGAVARLTPTATGNAAADPWNQTLLAQAGDAIDFLAVHLYYPTALLPEAAYQEKTWLAGVMGAASQALRHVQQLRGFLNDRGPAGQRLKIAITEYGIWPVGSQKAADYANLARALFEADLLLSLVPQAEALEVILATAWNLHGQNHTAAIHFDFATGSRRLRPHFFVGELCRQHLGQAWLPVQVQGPTLSTPTVGNVAGQTHLPQLQVLATVSVGGPITVLVLNRSLQHAVSAKLLWEGCKPPARVRVLSLTGASPLTHNEGPGPHLGLQQGPVQPHEAGHVYTFPPHSLTGLLFAGQP